MTELTGMTCGEITAWIREQGYPAFRGKQIFRWIHQGADFSEMTNLPETMREKLKHEAVAQPVRIRLERKSPLDGTVKFLYELLDGNCVEGVLMRYKYGVRLCVSTQVGCRMGCSFCASTIGGLVRDLTPAEMLSQVYDIERDIYTNDGASSVDQTGGEQSTGKPVEGHIGSIIVMGMGEPFDNYDNLISFIRLLTDKDGRNLSARGVTVSTCGIPDGIRRLADEDLPITLALSLHAPNDDIRRRIMPIAKAYPMDEVFGACRDYFSKTGRRITFEYSMISGINDTADAARELAKRCDSLRKAGCMLHVNLIPLNEVSETGLHRADSENIQRFKRVLEDNGITVTVRREMGAGIDAACGQLRHKEKTV